MVQAYSRGYLDSLEDIRAAVRGSFKEVRGYEPRGSEDEWDEAYEGLRRVMDTAAQRDTEGASLE
jgi:hypothetical protein